MGKVYKRDNRWGIDYVDHRGRRIRKVVASDKSVAQKMLGDAIAAAEKMKAGILNADPREAQRPLDEHLTAYLSDLRRRGRDAMYCYTIRKRIEAVAKGKRWKRLGDCTARGVNSALETLSNEGRKARTLNGYRSDLSAFFGWCVRTGRLEANPCDSVATAAVKADKTRRALSVAECRQLLGVAPPERRVVYLFLIYTGLRRSEAGALRWYHLHLDVANPYVELPANLTKSGRAETVPLVPELAAAMREHRGEAEEGDTVFESIPTMAAFRRDLAAAGIPEQDVRGRVVVLHSLATMLAISGVPIAIAQRILRHRDIRLTAEVYCDEGLLPVAYAMTALPSLAGAETRPIGSINGDQNVPTSRHGRARGGRTAAR